MWNGIKRQLRSVIEWVQLSDEQLFYRWTDTGDEIKIASKLIVGPGQGCIFVYEGIVQAMHVEPGMVNLDTDNIPFWTTVKKFMQAFESEHKVGMYFFRTAKVLDQKWGTTSPIKYVDSVYQFPVGLKAYGSYSYRINNPLEFFVNVLAGQQDYSTADFRQVMSDRILHPLSDYLAEMKHSYNEIDAFRDEIGEGMRERLDQEFDKLGFTVTDFRIEGTAFDDNTLERINRIADVTAESAAAKAAGMDYAGLQHLEALREAARNEGGAAGAGVGIGAGIGLGQAMTEKMTQQMQDAEVISKEEKPLINKLNKLKEMCDADLITEEEYATKKQEILDQL
ncbi:MAG: SPFH domain-containing protein [Pseudomonadales bacterium]